MTSGTNVDAPPTGSVAPTGATRWHDLDALRGFAMLISYQLFVRYTPLGTLLNGKRTRPSNEPATPQPTPDASTATT